MAPLPFACPLDHTLLERVPGGLRTASGRLYPEALGGWDLRASGEDAGDDAQNLAQGAIFDALGGELSDLDHPHNLTLVFERDLLEALPLTAGERVLEIGGHRSGVLPWLEARRQVLGFGVDLSAEWVARQNRAARERGSDTTWVRADAEHLPFVDRAFAAVVAFDVFEHVGELEAAVAEAFRVLRPGGHLVCHLPVNDIRGSLDGASRWRDPADFAARQATVGHFHERMPTRDRMRILLEHVGFHVRDVVSFNVWVQPLHDYRVLPALARLRRRFERAPKPSGSPAPPASAPAGGPRASAWQRAYARTVIPAAAALARVDRIGAALGVGGSCAFVAERPGDGGAPWQR
jgi:SAM-dependent methyltransferase